MNTFPAHADNNEMARFLYYQGRIKAMQLDYSAAAHYLLQAMRKAPQESGIGFKQNVISLFSCYQKSQEDYGN